MANPNVMVQRFIDGEVGNGASFDEACKTTVESYEGIIPGLRAIIQELKAERERDVLARTKLTEIGIARRQDLKAIGWYPGVHPEKGVWGQLRRRMLASGLADAVDDIDSSTEEIVSSIAQPNVEGDKRRGLVIGNVQSGKTANFSAVIAKAIDSKYRFILVLSGVHNNLRKQTQERLERDLGVRDAPRAWHKLTNTDRDFGSELEENAAGIVAERSQVLAIVKKNGTRLRNVLRFLRSLDAETRRRTPFLIVDDESDQATPDSSADLNDDPTAINRLMREIWAEIENGTYLGYTATPFANVFMDPNSGRDGGLEELYPKDFLQVMPTPRAYFGAERIFGLNDDADRARTPDVVREISEHEYPSLAPKNADPTVTRSLGEAIRWFIVAAAVRRTRGQNGKHSTMLIHTTHRVAPHFAMKDAVNEFLEPLRSAAREGDVEAFRDVFHRELDRAAELYTGAADAPSWPEVRREIPNVLRVLQLSVDNGQADAEERLSYSDDEPKSVIVIGGGTLSRGLTLEGLFVSYFTRTSNTYDTLLQMGRWFGYRPEYEDLQRIWMSPGLDDDYRFLATVEAEVRDEVARMTAANQAPGDIGVRVSLHPGRLQITSPAKMKHTTLAQADFEGFRLQTTRFDGGDPSALEDNVRITEELRTSLLGHTHPSAHDLFLDVPVHALRPFFERFTVHPRFEHVFREAFAWSADKLSDKPWNVVIPFDDSSATFTKVNRSALPPAKSQAGQFSDIDIRALMEGGDSIADVRRSGGIDAASARRLSNADRLSMRRDPTGLDGRGLLILYPIDRTSHAPKGNEQETERRNLDEVLREIDPRLLENPERPLMGLALIAPMDSRRKLEGSDRGRKVAVKPVFGEGEILHDDTIVDTELDFRGGLA